jgi:V-type H+-transporting ATPase subunit G
VIFIFCYLDRVQRLKDARSEAVKDIEELKGQKNAEYQNFVSQVNNTD